MSDNSDAMDERVAREALTHDSPFYPIAPERMLLETRQCVAFLDTNPVSKGHALVVAKTVAASLFDLPAEVQAEVWETVGRAERDLDRTIPAGWFQHRDQRWSAGRPNRTARPRAYYPAVSQ